MAGILGVTVAVTVAMHHPFDGLAASLVALMSIGCGWVLLLVFAPWRHIVTLEHERVAIVRLTRELQRAATGRGDVRLSDELLEQRGELGDLSRALQNTIGTARADRRESRRLQRSMEDEIRRETKRVTRKLQREATTDPLTGLSNRREMDHRLTALFGPDRRRRGESVVAMLIDFDYFKKINDTLGHKVGDECLAFLGELLASTLRREDTAIRLGGDEFAVLMPNQTIDESVAVADRLRALYGQMPWAHCGTLPPTLSIGLAFAHCADPKGPEDVLRRADAALYRAKEAGRNKVEASFEWLEEDAELLGLRQPTTAA